MRLERRDDFGDLELGFKNRFNRFIFFSSAKSVNVNKIIELAFQKHFDNELDDDCENYWDLKLKIILMLFNSRAFHGKGFYIQFMAAVMELKYFTWRIMKFLSSKPVRGHRTRDNKITSQKVLNDILNWTLFIVQIRRRTFKKRAALATKNKKKAPVKQKKKTATKAKGPVKRSRDTKKSVWD